MAVNGTDFVSSPWDTIFDAFTDLLGSGFYVIPLSFVAVALYVKTRNATMVSMFILASGIMLSSGNIFMGYPEVEFVYIVFTVIGIVGTVLSLYFSWR